MALHRCMDGCAFRRDFRNYDGRALPRSASSHWPGLSLCRNLLCVRIFAIRSARGSGALKAARATIDGRHARWLG
jgi:hypothetical protein